MKQQTANADLGQGWYATMYDDGSCTVRNCDKGLRIDLEPSSVDKFCELYDKAGKLAEGRRG